MTNNAPANLATLALIYRALEDSRVNALGIRGPLGLTAEQLAEQIANRGHYSIYHIDLTHNQKPFKKVAANFTSDIIRGDARSWRSITDAIYSFHKFSQKGIHRTAFIRYLRASGEVETLRLAEEYYESISIGNHLIKKYGSGSVKVSLISNIDSARRHRSLDQLVKSSFSVYEPYTSVPMAKAILIGQELPSVLSGQGYSGYSFDVGGSADINLEEYSPYTLEWKENQVVVGGEQEPTSVERFESAQALLKQISAISGLLFDQVPHEQFDQRISARIISLQKHSINGEILSSEFLLRSIISTLRQSEGEISEYCAQILVDLIRMHGLLRRLAPELQKIDVVAALPDMPFQIPTELIERFGKFLNENETDVFRADAKTAVEDVTEVAVGDTSHRPEKFFSVAGFFSMLWRIFKSAPEAVTDVENWRKLVEHAFEIYNELFH